HQIKTVPTVRKQIDVLIGMPARVRPFFFGYLGHVHTLDEPKSVFSFSKLIQWANIKIEIPAMPVADGHQDMVPDLGKPHTPRSYTFIFSISFDDMKRI